MLTRNMIGNVLRTCISAARVHPPPHNGCRSGLFAQCGLAVPTERGQPVPVDQPASRSRVACEAGPSRAQYARVTADGDENEYAAVTEYRVQQHSIRQLKPGRRLTTQTVLCPTRYRSGWKTRPARPRRCACFPSRVARRGFALLGGQGQADEIGPAFPATCPLVLAPNERLQCRPAKCSNRQSPLTSRLLFGPVDGSSSGKCDLGTKLAGSPERAGRLTGQDEGGRRMAAFI